MSEIEQLAGSGWLDDHASAVLFEISACDDANGFWQGFTFGLKDSFCERIGSIVVEHIYHFLNDDGACVIRAVGKMDRTAGEFDPGIDGGFMNGFAKIAATTKSGNERRVNIKDPMLIVIRNEQEREESAEHDHISFYAADFLENQSAHLEVHAIDNGGWNAS